MEPPPQTSPTQEAGSFSFATLFPLRISHINGQINSMKSEELVKALQELKLNHRGTKEVLKKRLKNFYRTKKFAGDKKNPSQPQYPYFVVIDFEATCEQNVPNYPHEIIEFPAVLINSEKQEVVDEFHEYCQPLLNPRLSEFCTKLTGIEQKVVDEAAAFPVVLEHFQDWLASHQLGISHKFAIVTDGPWDMSRFLQMQCKHSQLTFPRWGRKWVNIRKVFGNAYRHLVGGRRIDDMLQRLGLAFEGRPHCGLHDSRNIARILLHMLGDQVPVKVNEVLVGNRGEVGRPNENDGPGPLVKPGDQSSPSRRPRAGAGRDQSACEDQGDVSDSGAEVSGSSPDPKRGGKPGCSGTSASSQQRQEQEQEQEQEGGAGDWEDQGEDVSDLLRYLTIQKSM